MIWSDLAQLFGPILVVVGALLPVVNPPGDAPIFLHMTAGCDDATRSALARRIAIYCSPCCWALCCSARSSCACSDCRLP